MRGCCQEPPTGVHWAFTKQHAIQQVHLRRQTKGQRRGPGVMGSREKENERLNWCGEEGSARQDAQKPRGLPREAGEWLEMSGSRAVVWRMAAQLAALTVPAWLSVYSLM